MNTLVKFIIAIGVFFAFCGVMAVVGLFGFNNILQSTALWLFSSLLPFRGIINLPAFLNFIVELMVWTLAWWSFHIANKVLEFFTGSSFSYNESRSNTERFGRHGEYYGNSERTSSSESIRRG